MYKYFFMILIISYHVGAETRPDLSQNLSIQGFDKAQESEKVRQGHLLRSFVPTLSLELGQERFQSGKYTSRSNPYGMLEAKVNLFRGGRDVLESKNKNLEAQISTFNRDSAGREEISKIRKIQWQIIFNNSMIKLLQAERKENSEIKGQASVRAKTGVATRSDELEFTIHASELDEEIESLGHENQILKIGLLPLLGLSSADGLVFPESLEHEHNTDLLTLTYSSANHPQVEKLKAESESSEIQNQTLRRWWAPSLDLYGGYYLYTLRDRDYLAIRERDDRVVGLRLNFELFDGFKSSNQSTATYYQTESKRLMARHLERQTDAQFLMYQEDLKHTHEVMHYVEERISKSRDFLKITLKEYDRGVKNSLDALTAMQRYYRYEKQLIGKKKEYQIIKTDLLQILGQ